MNPTNLSAVLDAAQKLVYFNDEPSEEQTVAFEALSTLSIERASLERIDELVSKILPDSTLNTTNRVATTALLAYEGARYNYRTSPQIGRRVSNRVT